MEADNGTKIAILSPLWCALVAGTMSSGVNLAHACGRELVKDDAALDHATICERIQVGARAHAVRQFVAKKYGYSFDEVMSSNSQLSDNALRIVLESVENFPEPEQQIIFVGWTGESFTLAIYWNGEVWIDENHITIGTGQEHAAIALNARSHKAFTPIDRTVYMVYEAQRIGSRAHDVGNDARCSVLRFDHGLGRVVALSVHGNEGGFLDKTFLALQPKPFDRPFRLPQGIVDESWDHWPFGGERGDGFDEKGREIPSMRGTTTVDEA